MKCEWDEKKTEGKISNVCKSCSRQDLKITILATNWEEDAEDIWIKISIANDRAKGRKRYNRSNADKKKFEIMNVN